MLDVLALCAAALFTGAAFYINAVEHPARLQLDDANLLKEWKTAYARGYVMQASLAVAGGLLGFAAFFAHGNLCSLIGAVLMVANWPFTLWVIMPVNNKLKAIETAEADQRTRALLGRWNVLHAVRTALGALASASFIVAAAY